MKIQDLNGKKICWIGYALEGEAMLKALQEYAPEAKVTIADRNPNVQIDQDGVELQLGEEHLKDLDRFDVVIRSAGVPDQPEFEPIKDKVTNMAAIFFDSIADTGVRTIGITGSKGKSTTTTLIYNALHAFDADGTVLMGNLYLPMISYLDKAKPGVTFVIELSSYMLEYVRRSPNIAVVTSFFPEHLDRHGSVENYWNAKKQIASHQTADDVVFYNAIYPECKELAESSPGKKVPFTKNDAPLKLEETHFIGDHNLSNLAAAYLVATYAGVPSDVAIDALKESTPLPHRLQDLGIHAGVHWVNDSIATAPEATLAALQALGDKVETIFVGGFERGYDFTELAKTLTDLQHIKSVVVFPETGSKIQALMPPNSKNFYKTENMEDAVRWAAGHTSPGKTALLSCASPSFNLYKDFNARGDAFMDAVKALVD